MNTFSDLGLAETLLRAVAAEGYQTPTPIQSGVIPRLLAGEDVLGIAQTGTGKTASFVLPLLHQIAIGKKDRSARSAQALILAPTRELAVQIADEINRYARHMRVAVAVVVGGVKAGPQVRALARGVDIIVATPGRLLDHLSSGAVDLGRTRHVVLDEADQMLDLGFMPAIKKILAALPKRRQTALMSATMPPEIRRLAAKFQTDPTEIAVAPVARPINEIAQRVIPVESAMKREVLCEILSSQDVTRAIVFTRTKHGADKLKRHLEGAGLPATAIHGNKSQPQRQRALEAFRSGATPILIATDIAARGIHVSDISHVINYELPDVAEVYVHRIGRTARAGQSGIAISLCDPSERKLLRAIERLTGQTLGSTPGATDDRPSRRQPREAKRDASGRGANGGSAGGPANRNAGQTQSSRRRRKSRPASDPQRSSHSGLTAA
ncbi:MAG: DEAD/DEAH box helicase [Pseudomonadota bacterium]